MHSKYGSLNYKAEITISFLEFLNEEQIVKKVEEALDDFNDLEIDVENFFAAEFENQGEIMLEVTFSHSTTWTHSPETIWEPAEDDFSPEWLVDSDIEDYIKKALPNCEIDVSMANAEFTEY